MKILLVTFSSNADHQDITFGMFENLYKDQFSECNVWLMGTNTPKSPVADTPHTHLVNCPGRPGIEKKTFNIKELFSIISWINKQHFDAVFFETLHVWNLPIMMLCHKKAKMYQMIHDVIPHEGDKQAGLVELMNKTVCKTADYIVLVNRKYRSFVSKHYGIAKDRVLYLELWRSFPEYVKPRFTKRVLFFGRIRQYKGVDNLYKIAKLCPDILFDVIGYADPSMQTLTDELKKLPNIAMNNDYVSGKEMDEAFINADWVILPYNSATQSGVVIDSYRYGRPCIAFNVGAIAEQINDGVSGYLVEAGNIDEFVKKLREAVEMDKQEYVALSRSSYDYGYSKYAAETAKKRFIDLFRDSMPQQR